MDHIVGGTPILVSQGNLIEDFALEMTLHSFLVKCFPRTAVGIKENGDWVFVVVEAPELDAIRQKYGLPKTKYAYHITIGIKPVITGLIRVI